VSGVEHQTVAQIRENPDYEMVKMPYPTDLPAEKTKVFGWIVIRNVP
jgi:hypothetical protein